ncbi:DUF6265 family protein [Wenyingzhuangia sp. 2_MG-2023]|uniref:DUF6265 family protein n=1 Tax=Wenyingzhuangia sp. 2_MG-2023 TaxID=3062639 RepID=UPI0026E3E3FC|nr:DUF6265 family protein [Wenyingzhuangia sp. 2_MG-2023]MDO6738651.1 DUF6265 family protein [Wenyingzhuangia sp. 2_MG-2023]
MKKLTILCLLLLAIACNQKQSKKENTTRLKTENFDWLLGKWQRLNESEGKETYENWHKVNENTYAGIGFTLQNGDTIKQENMRLFKTNGKWNLAVKTLDESEETYFNGVQHNANQFSCENKEIEFPNEIKYWKNGDNINASVSGSGMEINFEFVKIE